MIFCLVNLLLIALGVIVTFWTAVVRVTMRMVVITGAHKPITRVPTISVRSTGIRSARARSIIATYINNNHKNQDNTCRRRLFKINILPVVLPLARKFSSACSVRKSWWLISRYWMLVRIQETYLATRVNAPTLHQLVAPVDKPTKS